MRVDSIGSCQRDLPESNEAVTLASISLAVYLRKQHTTSSIMDGSGEMLTSFRYVREG